MNQHDKHGSPQQLGQNWSRVIQWLLWLGLAAAVVWLVVKHGAHLVEVLPFLFLLACPLLHFFGHRGHGNPHDGHGGYRHDTSSQQESSVAAGTGPADPSGRHS